MATLTVSHYIYINRKNRYRLHAGETINVTGISVPVWFHKGNTSEPAEEIFCRYQLTNHPENRPIIQTGDGFSINLPQKSEQDENSPMRFGTSDKLLDMDDGGSEWLEFRQYGKALFGIRKFDVIHFVEIKPIELLVETLA